MRRKERLKAVCGWMTPQRAELTKAQIAEIVAIEPQYSESRVVNEAIAEYLPKLQRRLGLDKVAAGR